MRVGKLALLIFYSVVSVFASCVCHHGCPECRSIMPQIEHDFEQVRKKFDDKNEEMGKAYSKVIDEEKVSRLIEMRSARDMKEMTLLQKELLLLEKEKEFLLQNDMKLTGIETRAELIRKEMEGLSLYVYLPDTKTTKER